MELVPRPSLSPEQAAKLRELVKANQKARSAVHHTVYLSEDHMERLYEYSASASQLDAYITSLAGDSK